MKFQPDRLEGRNAIGRLEGPRLWVGAQPYEGALVVPWQGPVISWVAASFEGLSAEHFQALVGLEPELVIFGSGPRLRFARPALYRVLIDARIGMETMDTAAACRTFNVLASEGRRVVAALLPSDDPPCA
jgi:uncharacterized protein